MQVEAAFWQTKAGPWTAKVIEAEELDWDHPWQMIKLLTVTSIQMEGLKQKLQEAIARQLGIDGDKVNLRLRYLSDMSPDELQKGPL
jgi:hypothetical protein